MTRDTADAHDMTRRTWLVSSGTLLLAACAGQMPARAPSPADASATHLDTLDPDVRRMMRIATVPGMAVASIADGNVAARGYGVTRADDGLPVTADTIFEAASLSKPVFAYLVHTLAMDGTLDLDRPLGELLPLPNPSDAPARTITARHVLSHSSGWRNWRSARDQVLTADFTPGSRFNYSGEGYYFLQRVVERVTGKGILRLTRERIFEPLGMRRSSYMWSPALDAGRAEPHTGRGAPIESFGAKASRGFRAAAAAAGKTMDDWTHEDAERALPSVNNDVPIFPNFLLPNVAGSLLTTATDYATFIVHLLGTSSGRAVLDRMTTPQVTINEAVAWGSGLGLQSPGAPDRFWHWGDNAGFKNILVGDPATRRAIVVFTNGDRGRVVYERVVRMLRGADEPAFLWI